MSTKPIGDGVIDKVTLYKPITWLLRYDVAPFFVAYTILFSACSQDLFGFRLLCLITLPLVLSLHLTLFLLSQWSIELKCKLGNRIVDDISKAEIVLITAAKNVGKNKIETLRRANTKNVGVKIADIDYSLHNITFEFQKVLYGYNPDKNTFVRLVYPTIGPVKSFLTCTGHKTINNVETGYNKWGLNVFEIPIPLFLDLYMVTFTLTSLFKK